MLENTINSWKEAAAALALTVSTVTAFVAGLRRGYRPVKEMSESNAAMMADMAVMKEQIKEIHSDIEDMKRENRDLHKRITTSAIQIGEIHGMFSKRTEERP